MALTKIEINTYTLNENKMTGEELAVEALYGKPIVNQIDALNAIELRQFFLLLNSLRLDDAFIEDKIRSALGIWHSTFFFV